MLFWGDVTSNPGNSGGPVYRLQDAKIVGMLTASRLTSVLDEIGQPTNMSQSASLAVIVPGYSILKFINDNNISLSWKYNYSIFNHQFIFTLFTSFDFSKKLPLFKT